jgi:hypothetical protein
VTVRIFNPMIGGTAGNETDQKVNDVVDGNEAVANFGRNPAGPGRTARNGSHCMAGSEPAMIRGQDTRLGSPLSPAPSTRREENGAAASIEGQYAGGHFHGASSSIWSQLIN